MMSKIIIVLFHILLYSELKPSKAQTWIKSGYWFSGIGSPISDINSALFTHLICAFADVNSSSYELSLSSSDEQYFSTFTNTVSQKNPSVTTLLSIAGGNANHTTLSSMVSTASYRKSFIDSSIKIARLYGFQGLDFSWLSANTSSDMTNMGLLFQDWRAAVNSEAKNSSQKELILTAAVPYSPNSDTVYLPVDSIRTNLNWVHVNAYDYHAPGWSNYTGAHAALYDPSDQANTDHGIGAWIGRGLSASKLVLGLPFYGYAWTLKNPNDNGIGAPATGPAAIAIKDLGAMRYYLIKSYAQSNGAAIMYNATYVVNYCTVGSTWIGFDDVEAVRMKVSYAREKKLLGYVVWQVPYDDNWALSLAAQGEENNARPNWRLLVIILTTTATIALLLCLLVYYLRMRKLRSIAKKLESKANNIAAAGDSDSNIPNLQVFSLADIEAATNKFSFENKVGEGGYGPVYKGVLPNGKEIAVKKLSKTSTQGFEEFKNEVMLTAKLQHVNLVRVLGFCIESDEQMLIYEYMPNKSLDFYLFDPIRRELLDWKKRIDIIEGVTQGLLYLQEYSRMIIIHRDLKSSNILLDEEMKPKISDFGMARIFKKDEHEANTNRIVGTYGYIPPEYAQKGVYSTKSDVYSFGVLLLQIISGKRTAFYHGLDEHVNLLEYAYELWKEGKGMEFKDPTLDDTTSSCKLIRCMQIALLCVQENAIDRPSMLEVSSMLKNETIVVTKPKKPAFSTKRDEGDEKDSRLQALQLEIFSVDDSTITEVVAR
ncbi:cysteine-rich receptor-like protein kinase 10 isoform X1 [Quercus lobata]|uniref:non-specific serine/threonine protein kinase n=1 Tax=Quercus lobata TaxID=97700 RepID=A0A7N2KZ38_QUELO|nr:cysteine-rich receptor-like protein kinase 10 isoform X1 [Quercus lobata]